MTKKNKGPWAHRLLIGILTAAMAILCIWLLGFVGDDIGSLPGPNYESLKKQRLDPNLVEKQKSIAGKLAEVQRQIKAQNARQRLLRDSTTSSQKTMNQLLEFQRLSLQKNVKPTAEEQESMAESQRRFLANQKQYQSLNQTIVQLNEKLSQLEDTQRELEKQFKQQEVPILAQFQVLYDRHEFKVAVIKLAFLLPLLLAGVWLFLKYREGTYTPLIYAFGIAVLLKVTLVIHAHFPSRYFKYILLLTALAIVIRILVYLLRMIAFPKKEWLLRQYREAYEFFLCPTCTYPIRRGPLMYRFWNRRSIKKMQVASKEDLSEEAAYTCPVCSTQLYENCTRCDKIRPSLLPACPHCGQVDKTAQATTS